MSDEVEGIPEHCEPESPVATTYGGITRQPTPPPRCRVLVEGKPCGKRIYEGGSGAWYHTDNSDNHYAYSERRVSGERRKFQYQSDERPNGQHRRNNMTDRRKAGKL